MSEGGQFSETRCVLVIGATSGIGLDLALAIHEAKPSRTVIIAGRRQEKLDEITQKASKFGRQNLHALRLDLTAHRVELQKKK